MCHERCYLGPPGDGVPRTLCRRALCCQHAGAGGLSGGARPCGDCHRLFRDLRSGRAGNRLFWASLTRCPVSARRAGAGRKSRPMQEDGPGHGCGHNLLGVGSLAAAIGVKQYLQDSRPARHRQVLRMPGGGKTAPERTSWRATECLMEWTLPSAGIQMRRKQRLHGEHHGQLSDHAITFGAFRPTPPCPPSWGAALLDALELMNVGIQFLREHVPHGDPYPLRHH